MRGIVLSDRETDGCWISASNGLAKWTIDFDPTRLDVVENPATGGLMATYRRSSSPDNVARGSLGSRLEHFETSYLEYLESAKERITLCHKVCRDWAFKYDGESPLPTELQSLDSNMIGEKSLSSIKFIPSATDNNNKILPPENSLPKHLQNGDVPDINKNSEQPIIVPHRTESNNPKPNISNGGSDRGKIQDCKPWDGSVLCDIRVVTPSTSERQLDTDMETVLSLSEVSDLESFMNSLNKIKTPEELNSTLEETLSELDTLISLHSQPHYNTETRKYSRSSSNSSCHQVSPRSRGNSDIGDQDKFGASCSSLRSSECDDLDKDSGIEVTQHLLSTTTTNSHGANGVILHAKSESSLPDLRHDGQKVVSGADVITLRRHSSMHNANENMSQSTDAGTSHQGPPVARQLSGGSSGLAFTPTKYSMGKPDIGPFLSALLTKLETMMQNTLYVNLLLTGLIMRLACFPQPLLRSFLLNHTLVFQPTVKSLIQVLSSVKHKVDCFSYTLNNFEDLLLRARRFMAWREETYLSTFPGRTRSESITSLNKFVDLKKAPRKGSLGDFLFRRNQNVDKNKAPMKSPLSRLQAEGSNYRYTNVKPQDVAEQEASLKTKNAVYCALVLEEFLKELAAVAQEHAAADMIDVKA